MNASFLPHARRIAVVGAGAAGVLTVGALARAATSPLRIDVVERSGTFGPGLAYGTRDELHLLNVPAGKLTARADEPEHFVAWARRRDPAVEPSDFLPRAWYGDYLRAELRAAEEALVALGGGIERIHGAATAIATDPVGGEELAIRWADGRCERRTYARVVLALGNVPGGLPSNLELDDERVHRSPWDAGALAPAGDADVLLVGAGLTAVDAALTLCETDPATRVVAVSRSGRLPFTHLDGGPRSPAPAPEWPAPATAHGLVRGVVAHVHAAEAAGYDWRDAIDGLRPRVQELWGALPPGEQRRLLATHLRRWDVRRHRMAPVVGRRLEALVAQGRVEVRAGGLAGLRATPTAVMARLRGAAGAVEERPFARVVNCTGPGCDVTRTGDALLDDLLATGRATPDAHRLGLRTDSVGRLLTPAGAPSGDVFTLGALRRGELWESTAIAEIRAQAEALAEPLLRRGPSTPRWHRLRTGRTVRAAGSVPSSG